MPRPLVLLVALLLAASAAGVAPDEAYLLEAEGVRVLGPESLREAPGRFPFRIGERITYDVGWWGIPVGQAELEIARLVAWRGQRLAHVVARARTNEFFSTFYEIRDRSESWIDIDALRTVRTATHTHHGEKETWEEVEFDWATHYIHVVEEKRHAERVKMAVLDAGPFLYDTFDVFYALRSLPLEPGFAAELPIYASRKVYGLHIDVEKTGVREDEVLGAVEALLVRPYDSLDGKPQDDGAGQVWVTAGPPHVPLSLRGWFRTVDEQIRVGGVRVTLSAYHPGDEGWPAPAFTTRPAIPWPERDGKSHPIWEVPEAVREARAKDPSEPGKEKVDGVLAPLRTCPEPNASRTWARLTLTSTPCS